jgi:hypothetical protein
MVLARSSKVLYYRLFLKYFKNYCLSAVIFCCAYPTSAAVPSTRKQVEITSTLETAHNPSSNSEQAEALLEAFKQQHLNEDCSFHFSLQDPKRKASPVYYGTLWTTCVDYKPVIRVVIYYPSPQTGAITAFQYIIECGAPTKIWNIAQSGTPQLVEPQAWLNPIAPNIACSLYDLAMPFIYWEKWEYKGEQKVKGRSAHNFEMYPDEASIAFLPQELTAMRLLIDKKSNALLKVEWVGATSKPLRSFQILNFKKVKGMWFVKSIDFIDQFSYSKSRLTLLSVAIQNKLPSDWFDPYLAFDNWPMISAESYTRL